MKHDKKYVDINADLAEGYPNDERLLDLVTSASLCCGVHAGSDEIMRETLAMAKEKGVPIGAHPGYEDRENFGRVDKNLVLPALKILIIVQLNRLAARAVEVGLTPRFVKPHGALYTQAQLDYEIAFGVCRALEACAKAWFGAMGEKMKEAHAKSGMPFPNSLTPLPILGMPQGYVERVATERDIRFVREGFPDRRYLSSGLWLVPRSRADAIVTDPKEFEAQVVRLIDSGVETLCIHGDDLNAVENALRLRDVLDRLGIEPRFWDADVTG